MGWLARCRTCSIIWPCPRVLASKIQTWSHIASASRARRYCSCRERIPRTSRVRWKAPSRRCARWGRAHRQRRSLPAHFGENRRRSGKPCQERISAPIRRLRPQAAPRHCHAWRENRDRFSHAPLSPILRDPSAGWTCPRCAA
jgi:hypothetical protein